MELLIEYSGEIGVGNYPDLLQFPKTEAQQFYIKNGVLFGKPSTKIDNGEFDNVTWLDEINISPDTNISLLELKTLTGFGIVGSYLVSGVEYDRQVMIIHEFEQDVSKYLNSASIKHSISSPISSMTLSLENPIDNETEIEGNIAINEKTSLLTPGAKVSFRATYGDSVEDIELGSFYIDRSNFNLLSTTASVDGRNLIGKALKDQTLNEGNVIPYQSVTDTLKQLLEGSNLEIDQFTVENNTDELRFEFAPNKEVLGAIEDILKALVNWKIEETVEGEIVIGSPDYGYFPNRSIYSFQRNKDIFSRQITRDDQSAYRKVCVHTSDWSIAVYKDVSTFTGWNLQSNKTLFVNIADGTSLANANAIATELANRLQDVGKIETFNGPFRPQLLVGDGARINDDDGYTTLGLITEITHNPSKNGFYTNFSVDSGGRLGRGRLADYINLIANVGSAGSIAYADILPPGSSDLTAYNLALAAVNQADYTLNSWNYYMLIVNSNIVTVDNTQAEVDNATTNIIAAQSGLVLKP